MQEAMQAAKSLWIGCDSRLDLSKPVKSLEHIFRSISWLHLNHLTDLCISRRISAYLHFSGRREVADLILSNFIVFSDIAHLRVGQTMHVSHISMVI